MEVEDATFCPYCAKPLYLKNLAYRRKSFPKIAGIITIAGSVSSIIMSILYLWLGSKVFSLLASGSIISLYITLYILVPAVIGILSFTLGLTGGLFAIKKRKRKHLIVGSSLLVVSGLSFFLTPLSQVIITNLLAISGIPLGYSAYIALTLRPLAILPFVILAAGVSSIILASLSKREFS